MRYTNRLLLLLLLRLCQTLLEKVVTNWNTKAQICIFIYSDSRVLVSWQRQCKQRVIKRTTRSLMSDVTANISRRRDSLKVDITSPVTVSK